MGGFASVWLGPWVRRCWPRLCVHLQVLAGHACDSEAMGEAHSLHTPCNNLPFCPHPAPTGALGQDGWAWVSGAAAAHDGSESTTLEAYGLADFVVHTIRCVAGRPRLVGLLSQESSWCTLLCPVVMQLMVVVLRSSLIHTTRRLCGHAQTPADPSLLSQERRG